MDVLRDVDDQGASAAPAAVAAAAAAPGASSAAASSSSAKPAALATPGAPSSASHEPPPRIFAAGLSPGAPHLSLFPAAVENSRHHISLAGAVAPYDAASLASRSEPPVSLLDVLLPNWPEVVPQGSASPHSRRSRERSGSLSFASAGGAASMA